MKPEPKRTPKRNEDQTRITFNLPKAMKEKIEEASKSDRRTVSPWLVLQLEKILAGIPSTLTPAKPTNADGDRNPDPTATSSRGGVKRESIRNNSR